MMKNNDIKVACIIGTRPEIIKMAPVVDELCRHPGFSVTLINTAQHRGLADDMLDLFRLNPHIDLNIMQENQSLAALSGKLFLELGKIITKDKFDVVLIQGDTTTTWVAAQIAFYNRIKVGHVEAGLRSHDIYQPFPEELNRSFVSKMATWHFCPTQVEQMNLLNENVNKDNIFITGNTVIDAARKMAEKNVSLPFQLDDKKRIILVTLHRRESFGQALQNILQAILLLTKHIPDIQIVYPVHPNPNVNSVAHRILSNQASVHLIKPLRYDMFVTLLKNAYLIMTDSGGIQEEAPYFNKPVLVLREKTERPLLIKMGLGLLLGTDQENIFKLSSEVLTNRALYQSLQKGISPYGDGHSAERIVKIIFNDFKKATV